MTTWAPAVCGWTAATTSSKDGIAGRRQRATRDVAAQRRNPATSARRRATPSPSPSELRLVCTATFAPVGGGGGSADYLFAMPQAQGEASMVLVWHRRIRGKVYQGVLTGKPYWADTPRLANLGLSLFVRDAEGRETLVAQSMSSVDNLQHIYLPALAAGHYRIHVDRRDALDEPWDYALAWRIEEQRWCMVVSQSGTRRGCLASRPPLFWQVFPSASAKELPMRLRAIASVFALSAAVLAMSALSGCQGGGFGGGGSG